MVSVTKHKLDGTGRRWESSLDWLDEAGHWLFCPAGTTGTTLDDAPLPPHTVAGIQLIVPGAWWTAWWWDEPRWIAIDVIEPLAIHSVGPFAYRDLELDLWWREGDCGIVDQDELEVVVETGLLAANVAAHATRIAGELLTRLQSGDPLFTTLGFHHLDEAIRIVRKASSPNGV